MKVIINKIEEESVQSPLNNSTKFYTSQAYSDSEYKPTNVLATKEILIPLNKADKELQSHFLQMWDKNNQFLYSNSNLSRQSFKNYLSKRYCRNTVDKILSLMSFPQNASYNVFWRWVTHLLDLKPIK